MLAALVILATLLVALLSARSAYVRQWSLASQRVQAAAVADALLTSWWLPVDPQAADKDKTLTHRGQNQKESSSGSPPALVPGSNLGTPGNGTSGVGVPCPAEGQVPGYSQWRWSTRIVRNTEVEQLGAQVVRLEISAQASDQETAPLVAVEVAVAKPGNQDGQ